MISHDFYLIIHFISIRHQEDNYFPVYTKRIQWVEGIEKINIFPVFVQIQKIYYNK